MGGVRLYILVFLAVLLSSLAALLPLTVTGAEVLGSSYRQYAVRDMFGSANLAALALPADMDGVSGEELAAVLRRAREGAGVRFTLIRRDGVVLADSDVDWGGMGNLSNREEVVEALDVGFGADMRQSPALGGMWIFAAVVLDNGNILRAGTSADDIDHHLWMWWKKVLAGCGVALFLLLGLAFLVARVVSRPLEIAAEGARHYAKGQFFFRIPVSGTAEMRMLANALDVMADELDSRFKLINRQRREMRAIFDNMTEGVLAIDGNRRIMMLNGAAERILGIPRGSAGKTVDGLIGNAEILELLSGVGDEEKVEPEREVRLARDGEEKELVVMIHAAPIREHGETVGMLAVFRDVTPVRRLEMMRRDFVANVSHELRTPITTIQSCLETLLEDGLEGDREETVEFLQMALRNTRRMGAIIGNLLFLSGMESGANRNLGKASVSPVRPVINEALAQCREDAESRRIVFEVQCEEGLTGVMNPQLIVHALTNLIDNAIKYGPEGGIIGITARRDGEKTEVTVSDKGPGIDQKYHTRVFERFYRVDGTSRIKQGSGLGLSLVKHIAVAQGGDIKLESEIGVGSRFKLVLPNE